MRQKNADTPNDRQKKSPPEWGFFLKHCYRFQRSCKDGGRYWARTSDPLLVREVLSQLS